MSGPLKLGVILLVGVIAVALVLQALSALMSIVVPIAIIGGIVLIVYGMISRKALGGGRRYLP